MPTFKKSAEGVTKSVGRDRIKEMGLIRDN